MAFSIWGRTVFSYPTIPGKRTSPRSIMPTRFRLISCFTVSGTYPLTLRFLTDSGLFIGSGDLLYKGLGSTLVQAYAHGAPASSGSAQGPWTLRPNKG